MLPYMDGSGKQIINRVLSICKTVKQKEEMKRFITLNVPRLKLDDLAGLTSETLAVAAVQTSYLGVVGLSKYQTLNSVCTNFLSLLHPQRGSDLTGQIREKDRERDALFAEIRRTAKAAEKSSMTPVAAAGSKIVDFLHPFREICKEPMMSQTAQVKLIAARYGADPTLAQAASTLNLGSRIQAFFNADSALQTLYEARLKESGTLKAPPATGAKAELVAAYNDFCAAVGITLSVTPSANLQLLFNEMNEIRRKYISRLPVPLDEAHTSVAPIPEQKANGRHLTPLPRVFYNSGTDLRELVFAQDFTVTYRNNINVGEARLFIHGKGKYTGRYETTFHII